MRTMNVLDERQIDLFAGIFFSLSLISLLLLWWITIRHHFYSAEVNMLWHMVDIDTTILIAHRIEYSHHHLIDTDELINWTPAQKINARRKKSINLHHFSVKARARNPIWLINKLYLVSTASVVDFFGGKFFVVFSICINWLWDFERFILFFRFYREIPSDAVFSSSFSVIGKL